MPATSRFQFTQPRIEALPPHPKDARSTEGEFSDTEVPGLKLLVSKNGRKTFYLRYTLAGRKRVIKLADYNRLPLAEVRQQAQALRRQIGQGQDPQAEKAQHQATPTLATFALDEYLPDALQRKRSANGDESKLRVHLLPRFGTRPLDTITPDDIRRYHLEIKGLRCAATANRHLSLLSKLFQQAVTWGRTPSNPCAGITRFAETSPRARHLGAEEVQRLHRAMAEEPNRVAVAALTFLLLTGLRKGQVLQAQWTDLDPERGTLCLPDTSGTPRPTILTADARALLALQARVAGNPFIFPGRVKGRALINPNKAFRRIVAAAGITDLRIQDLGRGAAG